MKFAWEHLFGVVGLAVLVYGSYQGYFVAPPDRFMGDVMRIMYVHVPAAWVTMIAFFVTFVAAIGWLWKGSWLWDGLVEASIEVGLVMGCLLVVLGMLWGKPTWGVYWTWDPRLTSVGVMILLFAGVAALRAFVDDPRQRATWSAVASIVAFVDVPIVYYSVRWWNSLHQIQGMTGNKMDPAIQQPMWINSLAFVLLTVWYIARRYRVANATLTKELAPCPE